MRLVTTEGVVPLSPRVAWVVQRSSGSILRTAAGCTGSVDAYGTAADLKFAEPLTDGAWTRIVDATTDRSPVSPDPVPQGLFGHDPTQVDAAIQELQADLEAPERDAQLARARDR